MLEFIFDFWDSFVRCCVVGVIVCMWLFVIRAMTIFLFNHSSWVHRGQPTNNVTAHSNCPFPFESYEQIVAVCTLAIRSICKFVALADVHRFIHHFCSRCPIWWQQYHIQSQTLNYQSINLSISSSSSSSACFFSCVFYEKLTNLQFWAVLTL